MIADVFAPQGHFLEKPTTLKGDLPGMGGLERVMTRADKEKFAKVREKKIRKGAKPMYIKDPNSKKVHGTAELKKSAVYPTRFCTQIAKIWLAAYKA